MRVGITGLCSSFARAADNPCIVTTVSYKIGAAQPIRTIDFETDVVIYSSPATNGGVTAKSFKELSDRAKKNLEDQRKSLPKQCQ